MFELSSLWGMPEYKLSWAAQKIFSIVASFKPTYCFLSLLHCFKMNRFSRLLCFLLPSFSHLLNFAGC